MNFRKGIDPKNTIDNLKELITTLHDNGKTVIVATIPEYIISSPNGPQKCNIERNRLLREFMSKYDKVY